LIRSSEQLAATGPGYPFTVQMTLDAHLGMTDAVVRCTACGQLQLLEMVEWPADQAQVRRFRVSLVDAAAWQRFFHDSQRAYCDLERMQAELHALRTHAILTTWYVTLDIDSQALLASGRFADGVVPTEPWRSAHSLS